MTTSINKRYVAGNGRKWLLTHILPTITLLALSASASGWEYTESMDKMRGQTTKYASTEALNRVPSVGDMPPLRVGLVVRRTADGASDAYLKILTRPGISVCLSRCSASVKFDNDSVTDIIISTSSDLQTMFIASPTGFIDKLKVTRNLTVETTFVGGTYQLEFNVAGLVWE